MPTEQDSLLAVLENLLTADDPAEARAYARLLRKPEAAKRLASLDQGGGGANLALWRKEYGPRGAIRWKDMESGKVRYSDPATGSRPGANPASEATASAPDPSPADVVRLAKMMLQMPADQVRALQERAGIDPHQPRYEVASGATPGKRLLLKLLAVDARGEAKSGLMTVEARRYVQSVGREALAAQTESARLATAQWQQYQGPHGGHGWQNPATGEIRYQEAMPHEAAPGANVATAEPAATTPRPPRSPAWTEARHEASQRVGGWLEAAAHVPAERRAAYGHALHRVLDGLTETGLKRFLSHCQRVRFAADLPELSRHWLKMTGEGLRPGTKLGGFFAHKPKTAEGEVYLDGGPDLGDDYTLTTTHVYGHELAHVLDGGSYQLSGRSDWMAAWKAEIDRPDEPLSRHARRSRHEGWAEFGRLALLHPEQARQHFPQSWAVWRDLGLVEDDGVRLSAIHAPKGGVTIGGKHFPGGEFIPADVMAQATEKERNLLDKNGLHGILGEGGSSSEKSPVAHSDLMRLTDGVDAVARTRWLDSSGNAYRVQDAHKVMPIHSANMWQGDDDETMPGTSGFANFVNAVADMLLGERESATGENYTRNVEEDGGTPEIWVLIGRNIDAPGAETVIPNAKVAAKITRPLLEKAYRQALRESLEADPEPGANPTDADDLSWGDLADKYELNDWKVLDRAEEIIKEWAKAS